MSKITTVEAVYVKYTLPKRHQVVWAGGNIKHRDYVFIKIETKDKKTGWGEIGEVYFCPQSYVEMINKKVKHFLVGKNAAEIETVHRQMGVFLLSVGYSGMATAIISGIDIALHNLNSERLTKTLKIPVYASTGFARDLATLGGECQTAIDMGFRNIKIRGGFSVDEDIKRVRAARKLLGKSIGLILELSQPYSYAPYGFSDIVKIGKVVRKDDLLWIEEPFWPEDWDAYKRLTKMHLVKVGAGENLYTETQFKSFGRILDVCQPDITRMGGLTSLQRIARHCNRMAPHQFGTSIALYTLCRNARTIKNLYMLELDLLKNPVREKILGETFPIKNGYLEFEDSGINDFEFIYEMAR